MVLANHQSQVIPGIWNNTTEKLYADGIARKNGFEIIIMESSGPFAVEYVEHSMGDTWKLSSTFLEKIINCNSFFFIK
jgi:hypothetical protein